MAPWIVRVGGTPKPPGLRYVLVDNQRGDSGSAREQAAFQLRPGEYSDIAYAASPAGLANFRKQDSNFNKEFGKDASIWDVIQAIQGWVPEGIVGGGDKMARPLMGKDDYEPPDFTSWDPASGDPDPYTLSKTDPIAAFLTGLGFDFAGTGPSSVRDFRQRQGQLGVGSFAGQRAADFFKDDLAYTRGAQSPEEFGYNLQRSSLRNPFDAIGTRALANTQFLAGLGGGVAGDPAGGGLDAPFSQSRRYFNPFNFEELEPNSYDIASQLTAALQGAGVSPLYNRGVNSADVQRMFTTFAGKNPLMANQGEGLNQNFLKYAADQYGLSRFFD